MELQERIDAGATLEFEIAPIALDTIERIEV
jgi:hypothetical protein